MQAQLVALSGGLPRDIAYHAASEALQKAVHARLAAVARPSRPDRLPR